jgi:cytochrome b involved in lipid metabolism
VKRIIAATIGGIGLALVVPQTAYAATAHRPADHRSDVTYTMADVAKHAKAEDCWTAVKDKVYDLTKWLPTQTQVTALSVCGIDSTQVFKPAKVKPVHTSGYDDGDDDGDHNGDHRGSQHRSTGAVKGASHDSDSDNWGHTQNPSKALYKSIKHYKIGRLGLVAATPPATTPPVVTTTTTPTPTPTPSATPGNYTIADVAKHAVITDCWTAIQGNVYNLTAFAQKHGGGAAAIAPACGKDGLSVLQGAPHGTGKLSGIAQYKIGVLV